jgi:ParB-like chromosome segregation protein Spo0J
MSEVAERLAKLQERVDGALDAAKKDDGASPVLLAVVEEFARKYAKARKAIDGGGSEREAVVEAEQAADSAKYAAEADSGLGQETREAILAAHDRVCVLKNKMDAS